MRSLKAYCAALSVALMLAPAIANSSPITSAAIGGSWELRTTCTDHHGQPGSCIEMKHGSLEFTFGADGSWNSVANDRDGRTTREGKYEIRKERIILKNADGSTYQDWQPEMSSDGQSFMFVSKQFIYTFARTTN